MSIDSHLSELVRRHQTIEEAILAETNHPAADDVKVHELKHKKFSSRTKSRGLGSRRKPRPHTRRRSKRLLSERRGQVAPLLDNRIVTLPSQAFRREGREFLPEPSRSSAHIAAPRTRGLSLSNRSSAIAASAGLFEFPIAIITLRTKRALTVRLIGPPAKKDRNDASSRRASGGAAR